jgi:hypothetical protein
MAPEARSFTRRVTWFTRVYKKKAKLMSILIFNECKSKKTYGEREIRGT